MTESDPRPDPDALLRRVQEEEAKGKRGALKVFFGFAPGVGKTYRMLQVARHLRELGVDVAVGLVETHRRPETAALVGDLEVLPRKRLTHRGHAIEELDLDAALARKPSVLLVDELAHTNAPGSRHQKRWQDVVDLLDAGIDVLTTMNVQHLESLNDVVAQITRVQVRETVPDAVLDRADAIELVDIAPEELLQRLREGKVYLPEQAERAAEHFFRRGNLLALRELALRRTAQHVDEDVREYREAHGVVSTWPAGERILVCVGPAPSAVRLIRAAARMAAGLRCPWVAAYVEPQILGRQSEADREQLESHLRLAELLGATVARLPAARVSEAILAHARKHNVTRIVVGKPTHPRIWDRLRGSLLDEIVRGSGDIDVHVIRGDEDEKRPREPPHREDTPVPLAAYGGAAALVALTTLLAAAIRSVFPVPDLSMLYLLAVMVAAIRLGRGPSLLVAGLSVAVYDFFFVPPFFTFAVADGLYFLTFAMLFGVGFFVSELTTRLKRQEQSAIARQERTAALYALSRDLGSADEPDAIAAIVARHAAAIFSATAFVMLPDAHGPLRQIASFPEKNALDSKDLGVAEWCFQHGRIAGLGTQTLPGSAVACAPLRATTITRGVLALMPPDKTPFSSEQRPFLDTFCRQAAFAFERAFLLEETHASALRAKTEAMRSSLLSAVSHDLRTPLAAITGAATSLRDDDHLAEGTRTELLDAICAEAERLERLVANLLDMTRLESGMTLKKDWVPLEEIVGSALTRLEPRLSDRTIEVSLPADLPLLSVDPVVFEQVFVNLLENAAKYAPSALPIAISATREGDRVSIEVADRGPGILKGEEEKIFEKFHRGAHDGIAGVGLGLAICRGIVEAHGGTLHARNRSGGGAVFRIVLPASSAPPPIPPIEETAS